VQATDAEIARLQTQMAIAQTARQAQEAACTAQDEDLSGLSKISIGITPE